MMSEYVQGYEMMVFDEEETCVKVRILLICRITAKHRVWWIGFDILHVDGGI